tara:strand:+ start:1319 stop:2290 length:972 start_codon:yes stop_codon:yes gene_type:complete
MTNLPGGRGTSPAGWTTFDAVCCQHNGETVDTKGRAGVITTPEGGFSHHCFNCNFVTGWNPGRHLGFKCRKLLSWLGVSDNKIQHLVLEALRLKQHAIETGEIFEKEEVNFEVRKFPPDSMNIGELIDNELDDNNFVDVLSYCLEERNLPLDIVRSFYWSTNSGFKRRFTIPCMWEGEPIGYVSRSITDTNRFINQFDTNFVFNVDAQSHDAKFVLVFESPIDALLMGGVAVMTNTLSDQKIDIVESLGKKVILVPDFDKSGKKLIEDASECGWSVSFPEWAPALKDAGDAVHKYGTLFTLKSILQGTVDTRLKIELGKKKYY